MKVVDLHPEDLLDKDARGELGEGERLRLEAHLARCATCRFEREVRADFQDDLSEGALSAGRLATLIDVGIRVDREVRQVQAARDAEQPAMPSARTATDDVVPPAPAPGSMIPTTANVDIDDARIERAAPSSRRKPPMRGARIGLVAAAALLVGGIAGAAELGVDAWSRLVNPQPAVPTVSEPVPGPTSTSMGRTSKRRPRLVPLPSANAVDQDGADDAIGTDDENAELDSGTSPTELAALPSALGSTRERATSSADVSPALSTHVVHSAPMHVPAPSVPGAPPTRGVVAAESTHARGAEPEGAPALFESASAARRRGDYARALELDRELQSRFPGSREAHVSQAASGRLMLDRGDPAGALASFDAYRSRGPGELDEAVMVGRATALERLGRRDEAGRAWEALLAAFPSTPYAAHARTRIAESPH